MFLSLMPGTAVFAAADFDFILTSDGQSTVTIGVGDEITVEFELVKNDGASYSMYSMQNEILYDTEYFDYVQGSINVENGFKYGFRKLESSSGAKVLIGFVDSSENGTERRGRTLVGSFKLKAKKTGNSSIKNDSAYVTKSDLSRYSSSYSDIDAEIVEGSISTPTPVPSLQPTSGPTAKPKPTSKPDTNGNGGNGGGGGGNDTNTATPKPTAAPSASEGPTSEPIMTPVPTSGTSVQIFDDVETGYWAYDDIMELYYAGIVNGDSPNTFLPENNITRAEFTKLVALLFEFEVDETAETNFVDVPAGEWYTPYIAAAYNEGIVTGYSETNFEPDKNVSRQEMCAIIGRKLNIVSDKETVFTDSDEIEDYAKPYVQSMTEAGFIKGYDDNTFRPFENATRAESAAVINRVKKSK